VDHVRSIASGGAPFPALAGLMSMCASCHSYKTRAVDRPGGSGKRFKGCGVDGAPVDASDAWWGANGSHGSHLEHTHAPKATHVPLLPLANRKHVSHSARRLARGGTSKDERSLGVENGRGLKAELICSKEKKPPGATRWPLTEARQCLRTVRTTRRDKFGRADSDTSETRPQATTTRTACESDPQWV
jgi:hypothetical protein